MNKYLLFFSFLICFGVAAQNIQLLGSFSYLNSYSFPTEINDCWGFQKNGNKYALVGLKNPGGFSILDITDPTNISEVYYKGGVNSTWRDIKVYQDYAYVVNESDGGLDVFDMSQIHLGLVNHSKPNVSFTKAHNVFVDETDGKLLVLGGNVGNKGILVYDVKNNPLQPDLLANIDLFYVHDAFMRNDSIWAANVLDGHFALWKLESNKYTLLEIQETGRRVTHNIWPDPSGRYAFTTDEISRAFVEAYDLKANAGVTMISSVKSSDNKNTIPHNTLYLDGYLYTSFYADGLKIFDAEEPSNLIEIGSFDTYPGLSNDFNGAWGVFPFGNGDTVLVSDQTNGLFVVSFNKARARKINIQFKDALTLQNIPNLNVEVLGTNLGRLSNSSGMVSLGHHQSSFAITWDKTGYITDTITIPSSPNKDTVIYLQALNNELFEIKFMVRDVNSKLPLADAQMRIDVLGLDTIIKANSLGEIIVNRLPNALYNFTIGAWGYKDYCSALFPIANETKILDLEPGYEWSMDFDFTATFPQGVKGAWETKKVKSAYYPNPNNPRILPGFDEPDCGNTYLVTEQGGINFLQHQPNLGEVVNVSTPPIKFSNPYQVKMDFSTFWIQMKDAIGEKDTLKVYKNENGVLELLETYSTSYYEDLDSSALGWEHKSLIYYPSNQEHTIIFSLEKSNLEIRSELMIDQVVWEVISRKTYHTDLILFPNPKGLDEKLYFTLNETGRFQLEFFDVLGKKVAIYNGEKENVDWQVIDISSDMSVGTYYYQLQFNDELYQGKLIIE